MIAFLTPVLKNVPTGMGLLLIFVSGTDGGDDIVDSQAEVCCVSEF